MSMNYNTNPSGYGAQPDIPFSIPAASSQLVSAVETPAVVYTEKRVEAAPVSVQGGFNTYQDYNANLHDYNAPVKKNNLFSLRNILLGVGGLVLGGLFLWGLISLLKHLFGGRKTKNAETLITSPLTTSPLTPTSPIYPGVSATGQYTPGQLNSALKAAIAAGALPALGGFAAQDFSRLTPLTPGDVQQLLLVQQQYGSVDSSTLRKLGLSEAQYNFLLQNALTNGLLSQDQLRLLILNPHGGAAFGIQGNLLQPTFTPSDVQQLLGIAKVSGKFDDKSLNKFGILRSQFLNQLQNAARNGFVSKAQLEKLGVRISDAGILSLKN